MDDFSNHILDDYHNMNNATFDDEVDLIDETIDRLSNRTINSAAGSVTTTTYSVHQSPHVRFTLPTGDTVRRELADLLYVVNTTVPAGHHETRAMLS